jgi:hypothetical protein
MNVEVGLDAVKALEEQPSQAAVPAL